jgi:hypothetical protein
MPAGRSTYAPGWNNSNRAPLGGRANRDATAQPRIKKDEARVKAHKERMAQPRSGVGRRWIAGDFVDQRHPEDQARAAQKRVGPIGLQDPELQNMATSRKERRRRNK